MQGYITMNWRQWEGEITLKTESDLMIYKMMQIKILLFYYVTNDTAM